MEGYLGETVIDIKNSPYKDYKLSDWIMYFIEAYGQIDGDHHKAWVLDQIARIVKGTNIIIKVAKWEDGYVEYRFNLETPPSIEYNDWVNEMLDFDENGEPQYSYETGIAP